MNLESLCPLSENCLEKWGCIFISVLLFIQKSQYNIGFIISYIKLSTLSPGVLRCDPAKNISHMEVYLFKFSPTAFIILA
jgi:hypothetical protein